MPKTPVDEAPAGPAMDAAVAGALEHTVEVSQGTAFQRMPIHYNGDVTDDEHRQRYEWVVIPSYSTDIAAAWEMESTLEVDQQFDYVMALFNLVTVDLDAPDFHTFNKAMYWRMVHASPLDRCRAFLKANGIESVEVPG